MEVAIAVAAIVLLRFLRIVSSPWHSRQSVMQIGSAMKRFTLKV